ncbi:MAG: hypothetical protein Q7S25_01870 [Candidatus Limnocylindria bacterium]|nr:hypothetical protein [Candidatus Limnocylindria bacterium]
MPGGIQRLSRDLDFLGFGTASEFETILDRIADHYGRQLFNWKKRTSAALRIPMYAYEVAFPTPAGPTQTLVLDVVPLPLTLPTVYLPLNKSAIYVPLDAKDAVLTLSVEGFIADKLPTLGFDTHGYARPVEGVLVYDGHPEHIWKQIHDLAGLTQLDHDLVVIHDRYRAGIDARSEVRHVAFTTAHCLKDAWRVCQVAFAALNGYPADDPADPNYLQDVLHVQAGINTYAQYAIGPWSQTARLRATARTAYLVATLRALDAGALAPGDIQAISTRIHEVVARVAELLKKDPVHRRFLARRDGITWSWAIGPRDVYVLAPEAAIYALVADDLVTHAQHVLEHGEFSFER